MASNDVQIIVARARVHKAIQMELAESGPVEAKVGDQLVVKFPYKLIEGSREKEAYEFELTSGLGPVRETPAIANWGDRWGWPDERWGLLHQTFHMAMPGVYELAFRVSARYTIADWTGNGVLQEQRQELEGTTKVVVRP